MNLHTIEVAAAYSSLALYGVGVLGFLVFALTFISTSFKHFIVSVLLAPVWPIFLGVALIRQRSKTNKTAPRYVEFRTK